MRISTAALFLVSKHHIRRLGTFPLDVVNRGNSVKRALLEILWLVQILIHKNSIYVRLLVRVVLIDKFTTSDLR